MYRLHTLFEPCPNNVPGEGCVFIIRRFHGPEVLSYTFLQTLTQSSHFLLTKRRLRVRVSNNGYTDKTGNDEAGKQRYKLRFKK